MFLHIISGMTFLWFTKSGFNILDKLWLQRLFFWLQLETFIRRWQRLQDCHNTALSSELTFLAFICQKTLKVQFDVEKIWYQFLRMCVFQMFLFSIM